MRSFALTSVALLGGCSLLVDTSDLSGGAKSAAPDAGPEASTPLLDGGPSPNDGGTSEAGGDIVLPPPTSWTRVADAPAGRHSARAVWDAKREVVVIYGGHDGADRVSDGYEFDGTKWTRRTYIESPLRQGFAFVWDSKRSLAVLVGGHYMPADVWELDGTTWKDRGTNGLPSRMAGFNGVYDTKRSRFFGFGGNSATAPLADAWSWDGTTMTHVAASTSSPGPLRSQAMAYDEARDRIVMFGGTNKDGTVVREMWTFDGTTWTLESPQDDWPTARSSACMAYDRARQLVVMFGGKRQDASTFDETWLWDGTTWKAGPRGPDARRSCALAYDGKAKRTFLYGGTGTDQSGARNDAWTLQ